MTLGPLKSGNVRMQSSLETREDKDGAYRSLGPVIEGMEIYKALAHTANWSPNIDWKGKRVTVIAADRVPCKSYRR